MGVNGAMTLHLPERACQKCSARPPDATRLTFDTLGLCDRLSSIPKQGMRYAGFQKRRACVWGRISSGCRLGSRSRCQSPDRCQW